MRAHVCACARVCLRARVCACVCDKWCNAGIDSVDISV